MRLQKVRAKYFRGLVDLKLEPKGENLVLVGPNGSGKSAVTEAINFLLTGEISSLKGEGSGKLSLKTHGPHVNAAPEESFVEAVFSHNGDEITLKRTVADKNTIKHTGEELPDGMKGFLDAASNGLNFLSRDEILQFIVAQEGTRADQIEALMEMGKIDEKRIELNGAVEKVKEEVGSIKREMEGAKENLLALFYDCNSLEEILESINEFRDKLDGDELNELSKDTPFVKDLEIPAEKVKADPLKSKNTKNQLENILEWFEGECYEFIELDQSLRNKVEEIVENEERLSQLKEMQFLEQGLNIVKNNGNECPLCLREWERDDPRSFLEERVEKLKEIKGKKEEVEGLKKKVLGHLSDIRISVNSLFDLLQGKDGIDLSNIEKFFENMKELEDEYGSNLFEDIPLSNMKKEERGKYLTPGKVYEQIKELNKKAKQLPDLEEIQNAWDILKSADEYYENFIDKQQEHKKEIKTLKNVKKIRDLFLKAREEVLNDIYEDISSEFESYYSRLHEDEEGFSSEIEPTDTGVNLKVGFHNSGKHPPHALHSEGHQDSMGLCIYLALCSRFGKSDLPLIMLDDVLMSIDSEHRRNVAELLKEKISENYQLIITTHDEIWSRHLKSEGVVKSDNLVVFSGWSLENGPYIISRSGNDWGKIEKRLEEGDVQAAAHRLRFTCEWFLREVCDRLNATVEFKDNHRWNFGDYYNGATSKYKDLLKAAKRARQSWGQDIDDLQDLDNKRKEVYSEINKIIGEVSPNVHYSEEWASYTVNELEEVVDVFRELYHLFLCEECDSFIKVVKEGHKEVSMKCKCGEKIDCNLEEA